ncbi:uncharacterized protein ARB_07041 [Trichophyton benhamiae CBS 112371]|uniref:Uncharacterized protein n=1 Tax=Arthroderma benhamiae (strain ATCC MYA-4681 / CBS 112371) TaxID=663331 RepID=D4AS26_ARTBC|nr:uncharacterized protein ARB_07041 [Trichophyton benhamiae CBS 112371]EFE34090.1 conserved hypothetical protein [Trichophyton benhamiae CBS 112371]
MADNVENSAEAGNKQLSDIAFMAECFKYLQGPFNVDLPAVAEQLGYKNPASVGNRLRAIKKKWGIGVAEGAETGADTTSPATTPKTPRKGAKATRGPIKAKPEVEGEDSKAGGSPAKRGRKPAANGGQKRKASETNKENEEPKTENDAAAPETTKETEEEAA